MSNFLLKNTKSIERLVSFCGYEHMESLNDLGSIYTRFYYIILYAFKFLHERYPCFVRSTVLENIVGGSDRAF